MQYKKPEYCAMIDLCCQSIVFRFAPAAPSASAGSVCGPLPRAQAPGASVAADTGLSAVTYLFN